MDIKGRPIFKGLVYTPTHKKSLIHLGVIFEYNIQDKFLMMSLDNRTIMERTGKGVKIEFVSLTHEELKQYVDSMESWSISILQTLYSLSFPGNKADKQLVIF